MAFLAISSQMTQTGLDYAGARAGLDLAGIAVTPDLWADIRVIEAGAVDHFVQRMREAGA